LPPPKRALPIDAFPEKPKRYSKEKAKQFNMKTQNSKTHKYVLVILLCGAAALLSSCTTGGIKQCAENRRDHIPFITCQPVDQLVIQGDTATLSVKAQGASLVYSWYKSNGSGGFDVIPNQNNSSLPIPNVQTANIGWYYCTVTSINNNDGKMGSAQTRMAAVGMIPTDPKGTFIPCDWPYTSGSLGSICNPPQQYAAYDQFPTNEVATANGTVTCWILDKSTGNKISNSDYYMYLFHSTLENGCMTPQSDGQTFQMAVTQNHNYHFTAYFKSGHVPPAADVLELQGSIP
jgi:hypothetical protein